MITFLVSIAVVLVCLYVLLKTIFGSPKMNDSGRWIGEVYLVGDHGFKEVVFRNRYVLAKDSEYAALHNANSIRKRLIKKHGEGVYPGSVNIGGRSLVVMYKHYGVPEVNEACYLTPINTYKVLV
jgi:hypothetical protein